MRRLFTAIMVACVGLFGAIGFAACSQEMGEGV